MKCYPPKATKIPKKLKIHGDERTDYYYWLNQRNNQKVIDYLNEENTYFDCKTKHTKPFQDLLYNEMKARIKEDDESVPYKYNGYFYITRFEKGKDYPIYTRRKENLNAPEELIFDVNKLAKNHDYYKLVGISISPDNKWVAYGVDTVSRREYTIYIKNLETGQILSESIKNTTGNSTWANDNKTLFYTRKDAETLRANTIYRHTLQTNAKEDILIFEEKDDTFGTFITKTKSKKYLVIGSYSTLTSEYQILNANTPYEQFEFFQPRQRGLEYSISHFKDSFYILTNKDKAVNFKLMKTSENKTNKDYWQELIPHREDTLIETIDVFKDYLVVSERTNGLNKINIKRWDGNEDFYLPFSDETYTAHTSVNPEFNTIILRFIYNSLTTPASVIDFNMETKKKTILKETQVLGDNFNKEHYQSKRLWVNARDGVKIPISLVYHKNTKISSKTPLLLYAYGSYGHTIDPYFSSLRLSLLDRGFIFAIAHVRGGEYLGRNWYESGKLLKKKNTFFDFIDVSKFLIEKKYTSSNHLYASGGSAGGLLMGVIVNLAPKLYKGILASVPFVDVVTTMLDETIPLTTGEYDEWGNPNQKKFYDYIKSYSPYDNVKKQDYPNMLVTTGLHDSQVQYWEPVKWVAKLRELKKDKNILLLHTNMKTGHSGASGRFDTLKEVARDYVFILDLEGINK
ncbi:MAG: S9 family peptidase [Flavobacteriales bacterium]